LIVYAGHAGTVDPVRFTSVSDAQQAVSVPGREASQMEFRILGPLEVWDKDVEVSLGGQKPRALLALLLLHPNEVVSADRLIDELSGEDSSERAAAALRVNVSRLRTALPQDVLATRSPGYVLRVGPDALDLHRFERLVDEGRSLLARGLAADASERLREALSLWRGPALADFAYDSFAQAAIARLEEIRLAALELRIEADLALGRHDELVGELEALVAEHPLRERLRRYLMTALYRSGRQAEALDAYQDARRALVNELGIDPGPALQELERAILRQDPVLDLPPPIAIASTNLPRPASSFVGREHELAELLSRIQDGARLLTLTGPGGSGKTRLALEAAASLVPSYEAGVFWVGLAALRDAALVTATISQTLGARDGLAEHIGEREMLVLVDNFEQVIDAAPELSELLSACPNLTLLVTSRELLRVSGEVEYPVPALAEPEAVDLFYERSQLEPTDQIAQLCARLDNLPLAVELAAARTKALSPAQILERLSRLDLLRGGRDADPRHQTLRATIEWSYDLLTADEQQLFRRLSVFAGGCTLEAAEEVCGAHPDTVQSLVEKSLLRFSNERYSMLETIREYALNRLDGLDEAGSLRRAHAEYHLRVAQTVNAEIRGPRQQMLLEQVDRELANMRLALTWFLETVPEQALSLTLLLDPLWAVRGHLREGASWYEKGLARAQGADATLRASALREAGDAARMLGDEPRALMLYEESLRLETELGRKSGIADALLSLGREAESLAIFEEIGDEIGIASALHHLGGKALEAGDYPQAREAFEQAVSIRRQIASASALAASLHSLGDCALLEERVSEASAHYRESLRLALELQSPRLIAYCLAGLASVAAVDGRPEVAGILWAATERIERDHDFQLLGVERERYEKLLPEADPKFAKAHLTGGGLSFEQAIDYAERALH
jgi:predicted ATPase/DNA-binding SARP family transcriptional activator